MRSTILQSLQNGFIQVFCKALSLLILLTGIHGEVFGQVAAEYQLKASYIERFTRFITWPEEAVDCDTFVIAVLGSSPISAPLSEVFSESEIQGISVEIRRINRINEMSGSHIVFVPNGARSILPEVIKYVHDKPILTVADSEGFAHAGVLVNLVVDRKKLTFEINQNAVKNSGLKIAAFLMNYGKIIDPE